MRWFKYDTQARAWQRWFAWYPAEIGYWTDNPTGSIVPQPYSVWVGTGLVAWLEIVERKPYQDAYRRFDYRVPATSLVFQPHED